MPFSQVNLLAVVVGAVITVALGALWYSPMVFGTRWLRLMGKTAEEVQSGNDTGMYLFTFAGYFIVAFALALVVKGFFDAPTLTDGILTGVVVWLGFVATSTFVYTSFSGPSTGVWAIFMGYQLVALVIMGGLFAVWR